MALALFTSSEAEEERRALRAASRGELSKDTCLLEAQRQRGTGNTLGPCWVLRSTMEILACEEKR